MATTLLQVQHIPMIFLEGTIRVELDNTSKVTTRVMFGKCFTPKFIQRFFYLPHEMLFEMVSTKKQKQCSDNAAM